MKKQVLTALALMSIAAASCKVDVETAPAPVFGEEFVISADCCSPDTRMERDGVGRMYWSPGDEIGVFVIQEDGTTVDRNERFTAMLDAPACTTKFSAVVPSGWEPAEYYAHLTEVWSDATLEHIAIFPYVAGRGGGFSSTFQPPSSYINKFTFSVNFTDVQQGIPGTFDPSLWVAMAWSKNDHFSFSYPFGGIKFSVVSENVSKVTITCGEKYKNDFFASSKMDICIYPNGTSQPSSYSGTFYQTLEMIPQGGTFTPGETYYFVVPATNLMGGISFGFEKTDGSVAKRSVVPSGSQSIWIKPGVFKTLMEADSGCEWKMPAPDVTPTSIDLPKYGGEAKFDVKCGKEYTVTCDQDWLVDMGGAGDPVADKCTHTFVVKRNYGAARTATINVTSEGGTVPVTVTQAAGEPLADYPSIVRHHLVLANMSTDCNSGAWPVELADNKAEYGDLFEYVCLFYDSTNGWNECHTEHTQYKNKNPDYYYYFDGRRQVKSRMKTMVPVFAAESDDVYPTLTSIGLSSSVEGKTLSVDLSVYAYIAQPYQIAVYVTENARNVKGKNVWENTYKNVAHYMINEDSGTIAGKMYQLSKGMNEIHLSRELPVEVNGTSYSILAYIQAPYDEQPVIRDGDFYGYYYVDNCRLVPVGTTVGTEVK